MGAAMIEVNTSTLKSDVSHFYEELKNLEQDMNDLKSLVSQLSSMWDGNSKVAFVAAVDDDIKRLDELIGAIRKFTDKTDDSRAEYDKCENAAAGIVASIKV